MKRQDREFTGRMILKGLRDGLPIGLGYFAVAFSLGITARGAGISPLQGWVASILNHASAGEYALYALIGARAAVWEIAAVIFVTNMRYLLMSAALSQRTAPEDGFLRRLATGFCITDEIFGLAVAMPGTIVHAYLWTAFLLADGMWASGTLCGILAGNVLPGNVVTALSVAIYGMFLAIIIPPTRKNRILAGLIVISFLCSFAALRLLPAVSEGMRTVILTVGLSAAAALLFPLKDEEEGREKA
ncbi:MAG: AzlC family ABC transporter permease [Clostridia bacterium]|nr:AzlC family ABC transporter permease [Clostridia bacterium]